MFRFLSLLNFCLLAPDDGAPGSEGDPPKEPGGTEDNQGKTDDKTPDPAKLQEELEKLRKESSSKDKSVTKLQKELDDLKKAQMTEEERKAAEEKERSEKTASERKAFLDDCRVIAAERAGLKEDEAALISGESQEEIRENGRKLKALMDAQFTAGYEKAKKEGMKGGVPQGGDDPGKGTNKKLSDLFK